MMPSKLEAGPADVVDRGVHTAALRSHCRKGRASGEPFAAQVVERGTDGFGLGVGVGWPPLLGRGLEDQEVLIRQELLLGGELE
jgi:hypothetical protein